MISDVQLRHLCRLSSGYTITRRLEPAPADGLPAIQLGDVHGNDTICEPRWQAV